jgi:hypothetical protein
VRFVQTIQRHFLQLPEHSFRAFPRRRRSDGGSDQLSLVRHNAGFDIGSAQVNPDEVAPLIALLCC